MSKQNKNRNQQGQQNQQQNQSQQNQKKRSAERLIFFPEPMGVPVGFTYFYLFAEDFGMGAVRTAGRSAAPAAAGQEGRLQGFCPLNSQFLLFVSLAQIRDRRPLRNRGTAEDFYF